MVEFPAEVRRSGPRPEVALSFRGGVDRIDGLRTLKCQYTSDFTALAITVCAQSSIKFYN